MDKKKITLIIILIIMILSTVGIYVYNNKVDRSLERTEATTTPL